jgi:ABC-type sugar transport system substrate-binding protein
MQGRYRSPRGQFRPFVLVVSALCLALVVAGCSSSSKSDTSKHSGSSSQAGGGGSDGNADATKAAALLKTYETRPTTFSLTTPVGQPIPTGKKIAYINCGNSICASQGPILQSAAEELGWTVNILNTDGTPAQIQNAWAQVLRQKPDGVVYTSTPRSAIASQIKAVANAGIPIVACCESDNSGDGIIYYSENQSAIAKEGPAIATWITANSGGTGDAVFANTPELPILSGIASTLKSSLAEQCSACKLSELDLPLTSIGKNAPDLIVSYLRAHPKTKYLALSTDLLGLGLPTALKAAGINGIHTIGNAPGTPSLQYIAAGQQDASIIFPEYENMYAMIDALARKLAGVAVAPAFDPPVFIATKDNLPSSDKLFPVIPDIQSVFGKLWGKS